jgi:hypothetical protein
MTTKTKASQKPAAQAPAPTTFERQAPAAPRLRAAPREPLAKGLAPEARPGATAAAEAVAPRRSAREVILRLVETLKEL